MSDKEKFKRYFNDNPEVWQLFRKFALEAIEAGHKKYSAWTIVNRIRWETEVVTRGGEFKISNNHIAYYSRVFMKAYPQYAGFFTTKPLKKAKERESAPRTFDIPVS